MVFSDVDSLTPHPCIIQAVTADQLLLYERLMDSNQSYRAPLPTPEQWLTGNTRVHSLIFNGFNCVKQHDTMIHYTSFNTFQHHKTVKQSFLFIFVGTVDRVCGDENGGH